MKKRKEEQGSDELVSDDDAAGARRDAVIRYLRYRGRDLSTQKVAKELQKGRPELELGEEEVNFIRAVHSDKIYKTGSLPKRHRRS